MATNGEFFWQYWKTQLAGGIPFLNFAFSIQSNKSKNCDGETTSVIIFGPELRSLVANVAKSLNTTVYHVLLTGYMLLLSKYTNQQNIVVAGFMSTRSRSEFEQLLGFCIETVLLRGDFSNSPTAKEAILQISQTVLQANKHLYPFPLLKEKLDKEYGKSDIQAAFNYVVQNEVKSSNLPSCIPLNITLPVVGGTQFDLLLQIVEENSTFNVAIEFNASIFPGEYIQAMVYHFKEVLTNICNKLLSPIYDIEIVTPTERNQMINLWNNTEQDYPLQTPLFQYIAKHIPQIPNNIAVAYENEVLTYSLLGERVEGLAQVLSALGVVPNTVCGVYINRCTELVVAALAIFRVGAAYLPLELDYPVSRIEFMLRDASAQIVLTTSQIFNGFLSSSSDQTYWTSHFKDRVVFLDSPLPAVPLQLLSYTTVQNTEDVAYIIYTSGSTGTPKGVALPHRGLSNYLCSMIDEYKFTYTDKVLLKTSISFDVSVMELFMPLISGGTLVVAKQGGQLDPNYLLSLIQNEKVTVVCFVPSHIQALVDHPNFYSSTVGIHKFVLAGEPCSRSLFQKLGHRTHNTCGPSENTITCATLSCSTVNLDEYPYNTTRTLPIGRPIANTKAYILDGNFKPVPVGVPGELYFSGAGIGVGYLNRPELTAEKFIPNIFHPSCGKMFRSGDSAVLLPTGDIEILGRLDHQVKIRGNRIELGEIEACMKRHPNVKAAVSTVCEHENQKSLVAFIITNTTVEVADNQILFQELTQLILSGLPSYMLPQRFVILKEFPLTSSGKVDRKALKAPPIEPHQAATVNSALTPIEEEIRKLWEELDVHVTSNTQSFFDFGGSSLLAMLFLNKFQARFGEILPVSVFLNNPTLSGIAALVAPSKVINNGDIDNSQEEANWSSTEKETGAIWRKELKLTHIGLDDKFFDVGGDLIHGLSIAAQIETKFHIKVDADSFHAAATIRTLSKLVDFQVYTANGITEQSDSSSLVLIQQGTSRFPLFFVHPIGGTVFKYKYLAKSLGPKYTVYGLSARSLRADEVPHQDAAEMARNYVENIRTVQAHGPYHLGGHSFGGILALEMAQQLRATGESVDLLALFDSLPKVPANFHEDDVIRAMVAAMFKIDFQYDTNKGETWEGTLEAMRETGKIPRFLDANALHSIVETWRATHKLTLKYTPLYYKGSLQFFKAAVPERDLPLFTVDSWYGAADEVNAVVVPGDHTSMMEEHVGDLAAALLSFLKF